MHKESIKLLPVNNDTGDRKIAKPAFAQPCDITDFNIGQQPRPSNIWYVDFTQDLRKPQSVRVYA
jgi:hypothetical protein